MDTGTHKFELICENCRGDLEINDKVEMFPHGDMEIWVFLCPHCGHRMEVTNYLVEGEGW